jgi:hypothetical protein
VGNYKLNEKSTNALCLNALALHPSTNSPINSTAVDHLGCTSHFLCINSPCTDIQPASNGIFVKLPNGNRIQATHTALLPLPHLPLEAQ